MEKEHKCKCTTPWIAGIVIGIAIATVSCLVYFFVLNDGCVSGECLGLVARQTPTTQVKPIDESTKLAKIAFPNAEETTSFLVRDLSNESDGMPEAVAEEPDIDACVEDCLQNGAIISNGDIYSWEANPTEEQCDDYCADLLDPALGDNCGGIGDFDCDTWGYIDDCEIWRCYDCGTGAIFYHDVGDCYGMPG